MVACAALSIREGVVITNCKSVALAMASPLHDKTCFFALIVDIQESMLIYITYLLPSYIHSFFLQVQGNDGASRYAYKDAGAALNVSCSPIIAVRAPDSI